MHFLKDLIENPTNDNPVKNFPHVHRHFIRYSKGLFDGPAMRIKVPATRKKVTINASFEFEDLLAWICAKAMKVFGASDDFEITGNLISGVDFSKELQTIGLDKWIVKKSTGKTKNFKCKLDSKAPQVINGEILRELIEKLQATSYLLLNFNMTDSNSNLFSLKTKNNPPRPSSKGTQEESNFTKLIKFSQLRIPINGEIHNLIIDEIAPDFKDEILAESKTIEIESTYNINELILPPKKLMKNSRLFRNLTLRKGELIRTCHVDGIKFEKREDIII
ncbi:MAG: hypothetical protein ACTSWY_11040 [Promethearchaeota archaeon]